MAFGEYAGQPTEAVVAEQLEEDRSIITPRGVVEGHAGDWEVRYADGNVAKMTDDEWQAQGKPADTEKVGVATVKDTGPQEDSGDAEDTTEKNNRDDDSEDEPATPDKSPRDRSEKTKSDDDLL